MNPFTFTNDVSNNLLNNLSNNVSVSSNIPNNTPKSIPNNLSYNNSYGYSSLVDKYINEANHVLDSLDTILTPTLDNIQSAITNVSTLIVNIDLEMRTIMDSIKRDRVQIELNAIKKRLHEWKVRFRNKQKESLLQIDSSDPNELSELNEYGGQSRKVRDRMERTSLILKDSSTRLENSLRMISQSEEQGSASVGALRDQRVRLGNAKERLEEIDGEHRSGSRVIRRMEWRRFYNQVILTSIIICLLLAIAFVFYFGVIKRFF